MDAGGINSVVPSKGATDRAKSAASGITIPKKTTPGAIKIGKESSTDATGDTPKNSKKPPTSNLIKQQSTNNVVGGKKTGDDSDDPIAQAMALRIKAGGPTSVVSAADAKKLGLIKATAVANIIGAGSKPSDKKLTTPATGVKDDQENKKPNQEKRPVSVTAPANKLKTAV